MQLVDIEEPTDAMLWELANILTARALLICK